MFFAEELIPQRIVELVSMLITIILTTIIIRKVRCSKKKNGLNDKYQVDFWTEMGIHLLFVVAMLWYIIDFLSFTIIPVLWIFGDHSDHRILCVVEHILYSCCAVMYQFALTNILTNRVNTAFANTPLKLSKIANHGIRIISFLITVTTVVFPNLKSIGSVHEHEDGDCALNEMAMTEGMCPFYMIHLKAIVSDIFIEWMFDHFSIFAFLLRISLRSRLLYVEYAPVQRGHHSLIHIQSGPISIRSHIQRITLCTELVSGRFDQKALHYLVVGHSHHCMLHCSPLCYWSKPSAPKISRSITDDLGYCLQFDCCIPVALH